MEPGRDRTDLANQPINEPGVAPKQCNKKTAATPATHPLCKSGTCAQHLQHFCNSLKHSIRSPLD